MLSVLFIAAPVTAVAARSTPGAGSAHADAASTSEKNPASGRARDGKATTAARGAEARSHYRAGQVAKNAGARRAHFAAGITAARAALAANGRDADGLLWLAANLGAEALERGKLAALPVLPEMERLLLRLERVAPGHEHAAAARVLARLYHKAPGLISIGSNKKAGIWFARALARAPDFPGNQALAAAYYADEGDDARARALASKVLARNDLAATFGPDAAEWIEIARDILD